jgi:hypothetical protein
MENDRHSVVQRLHEFVWVGGQNGVRSQHLPGCQ